MECSPTPDGAVPRVAHRLQLIGDDPLARLEQRAQRGRPEWRGYKPLALLDILAAEPGVGDVLCQLGDVLRGSMPPRAFTMVPLRIACVNACSYLWSHAYLAHESRILTYREIAAIAAGPEAFDGSDGDLLRAVDELLAEGRLSEACAQSLGSLALCVKIAVGAYRTFASVTQDLVPEPAVPVIAGIESPAHALATYLASSTRRASA